MTSGIEHTGMPLMEERGRTWLVISRMDTTPTRKLPNARRRITFVRYRKMSFSLLQEVGTQAQPRRGQGSSGAPARLSLWGCEMLLKVMPSCSCRRQPVGMFRRFQRAVFLRQAGAAAAAHVDYPCMWLMQAACADGRRQASRVVPASEALLALLQLIMQVAHAALNPLTAASHSRCRRLPTHNHQLLISTHSGVQQQAACHALMSHLVSSSNP